ncbi:hypothetical protein I7I53_10945 [Histoplasma capsulatum var. duboisii H88]|uniref:Uncharacterized protein n=1 Tax=Ajellomyces capsulatus (strain H88) TaxID=544711 RepID=A0A8A1LBU2_AJEC8|nr:hypothetical protein I7I53_10945 [Histoplasma capsulatum var. duboisii H88]
MLSFHGIYLISEIITSCHLHLFNHLTMPCAVLFGIFFMNIQSSSAIMSIDDRCILMIYIISKSLAFLSLLLRLALSYMFHGAPAIYIYLMTI